MSVETGVSFGVVATDILAEDEEVWGVDLVVRDGLVSWVLGLRDLAALAGVVEAAFLRDAERASGRLGEFSREFKDEDRDGGVCTAA